MNTLVDLSDLSQWDDQMLRGVLDAVQQESARRALDRCDPPALIDEAFASAFTAKGLPHDPYLREGILVCPGGKVDRSSMNHECAFVRVDDQWVWERTDRLEDAIRHLPGPRPSMRSVTVLPAMDGMALDLVHSRTKMGVHQLASVRSFVVTGGQLELVSARAISARSHR